MQKMCLRCRSESYEKEIDLDQYMFGAGSASVLPGSGQSGIEGWTAAVVYGGAAGTFSVYGILRDDDEDRSCRRDRTSSLSVLHRLLGLSENGCYAMAVGFLSGYPLGAKTAADLLLDEKISYEEAQYVTGFCNNASPMFLLEYIGVYCMGLTKPWVVLVVVYGTAVLNAFLFLRKKVSSGYQNRQNVVKYCYQEDRVSVMDALDQSILNSFVTVTKVGGYIILFSILAEFVEKIVPCHEFAKLIGLGVIEITTGGEYLKAYPMAEPVKWIIACGIAAFGGLSSVAQTYSVLQGSGIKIDGYLKAKLLHTLLSVLAAAGVVLAGDWGR